MSPILAHILQDEIYLIPVVIAIFTVVLILVTRIRDSQKWRQETKKMRAIK